MYDILKKPQKNVKYTTKKINQNRLKSNAEKLSGQALAYTQETQIHMSPGQERNLPHEMWHVVQQMQERRRPIVRMEGMAVNDNPGLECETNRMGEKVTQMKTGNCLYHKTVTSDCIQRVREYANNYTLNIDANGNITNEAADRQNPPVSTLANLLFNGQYIGGHLLKCEYGGMDNLRNVVPWSREIEDEYTEFEGKYKNNLKKNFKGKNCTFSTRVMYCNIANLGDDETCKLVKNTYSLTIPKNKDNINQTELTKPQMKGVAEALNHFPKKVSVSVGELSHEKEGLGTFGFDILSKNEVMDRMRQFTTTQIINIIDSVRKG